MSLWFVGVLSLGSVKVSESQFQIQIICFADCSSLSGNEICTFLQKMVVLAILLFQTHHFRTFYDYRIISQQRVESSIVLRYRAAVPTTLDTFTFGSLRPKQTIELSEATNKQHA